MVGIIIIDLLIIPFFPRYILSMRKRIWIGNLFTLLSTVFIAALKISTTNRDVCLLKNTTEPAEDIYLPPYQLYVIPNILSGIGIMITYITSIEFIQAPYKMQGLIIGFWFLQFPVNFVQEGLGKILALQCSWQFYTFP